MAALSHCSPPSSSHSLLSLSTIIRGPVPNLDSLFSLEQNPLGLIYDSHIHVPSRYPAPRSSWYTLSSRLESSAPAPAPALTPTPSTSPHTRPPYPPPSWLRLDLRCFFPYLYRIRASHHHPITTTCAISRCRPIPFPLGSRWKNHRRPSNRYRERAPPRPQPLTPTSSSRASRRLRLRQLLRLQQLLRRAHHK